MAVNDQQHCLMTAAYVGADQRNDTENHDSYHCPLRHARNARRLSSDFSDR